VNSFFVDSFFGFRIISFVKKEVRPGFIECYQEALTQQLKVLEEEVI
jgi:hypothetical protein